MNLDLDKISNMVFEDIDHSDAPDYCDAFISSADYDKRQMTEEELDWLHDQHSEFIHEELMDHLY